MSSTDTLAAPSTSEGTGSSPEVMPMRLARATTFSGPTSIISWAYAVLDDLAVACTRSRVPWLASL